MQHSLSLDSYFRDLVAFKPLTDDQERRLLAGHKPSNCNRNLAAGEREFVSHHLRFVIDVAKRFPDSAGLDLEDRISAGNVGLCQAVVRFDPDAGYKFITYAVWWIRQAIQRAIDESGVVHVPNNTVNDIRVIDRERRRVAEECGTELSPEEAADAVGLTADRKRRAIQCMQRPLMLDDTPFQDGDGSGTWGERIADPRVVSAEDEAELADMEVAVAGALNTLPVREARIVAGYFGIGNGGERRTLAEMAADEDLTRERVRQVRNKAEEKLRRKLEPLEEYVEA